MRIAERLHKRLQESVLKFAQNIQSDEIIRSNGGDCFMMGTIEKLQQTLQIFSLYKRNESAESVAETNRLFDRNLKMSPTSKNAIIDERAFEIVAKESLSTLLSLPNFPNTKLFDHALKFVNDANQITFKRLAILYAFIVHQKFIQLVNFICEKRKFVAQSAAITQLDDFARKLAGGNENSTGQHSNEVKTASSPGN